MQRTKDFSTCSILYFIRQPFSIQNIELLRLAFPRRVFTLSQTMFLIDRVKWLFDNRDLVGGLKFVDEPAVLRFFMGRLAPVNDWPVKLMKKFKADFGEGL
jgi:tryptophanase